MASLPYDIQKNPTFLGMDRSKRIMRDVATGRRVMALVCSDPGFAKTYNAKHIMRDEQVPYHECSPTTEGALVRVLWGIESGLITSKGRKKPQVLLADDKDALFRRETANQMKSAFGSDRRSVTFDTPEAMRNEDRKNSELDRERARYKATIPDTTFCISVRFLGLANLNYCDPAIVAGLSPHFSALVSKGLDPSWIPNDAEHDGRDVFFTTHYLATEGKMLRSQGYSYLAARDAVEFYVRNVNRLTDIPPRRLSLIAKVIRDNPDPAEREARLNDMLRPTDQRPKFKLEPSWIPVLLWPHSPPRRPDPVTPDPVPPTDPPTTEPVVDDVVHLPHTPHVDKTPIPDPDPLANPLINPSDVDAVLDHELPEDAVARWSAFWGAVSLIDETRFDGMAEVLAFIKVVATHAPAQAALLFTNTTTRAIINAALAMARDDDYDPHDVRKTPIASIELIDTIEDTERKWDLRPMRLGRASQENSAKAKRSRAATFQLIADITDDEYVDEVTMKLRRLLTYKFWFGVAKDESMTLAAVIAAAETADNTEEED
jgi:hypothetical protein